MTDPHQSLNGTSQASASHPAGPFVQASLSSFVFRLSPFVFHRCPLFTRTRVHPTRAASFVFPKQRALPGDGRAVLQADTSHTVRRCTPPLLRPLSLSRARTRTCTRTQARVRAPCVGCVAHARSVGGASHARATPSHHSHHIHTHVCARRPLPACSQGRKARTTPPSFSTTPAGRPV